MSNPWARADEIEKWRHQLYEELKEAQLRGSTDAEQKALEDMLLNAIHAQAEEIQRVVSSHGSQPPKLHAFAPTGETIKNRYNPSDVGEVRCCTSCGARIVVWPDGRTRPVGVVPARCQ